MSPKFLLLNSNNIKVIVVGPELIIENQCPTTLLSWPSWEEVPPLYGSTWGFLLSLFRFL